MAAAREQLSRADYGNAAGTLRQALAVAETLGPSDVRRWVTRDILASTEETVLRLDDAELQYRAALDEIQIAIGKDNAAYAVIEAHLASLFALRGRLHQAETLLRDSLSRQARLSPAGDGCPAHVHAFLAEVLIKQHRYQEAEAELNLALPVLEHEAGQILTAIALNNFAMIRHHQRRDLEARQMLERSVDFLRRDMAPQRPLVGQIYHNLAAISFLTGRREEVGPLYRQALENLGQLGPNDPEYLAALTDYSQFLRRTGHKAEARSIETQVRTARAESVPTPGAGMTVDVSALHPD
ncbi:MAG: tetratricopeptide repeat protein [Bryobacteraceae bacterium]|jgi:tetratricopeptide (TPR) repeat protein